MGDKMVRNDKMLVFLCKMKTLSGFKELNSELKSFVEAKVKIIDLFRGAFNFSKWKHSQEIEQLLNLS